MKNPIAVSATLCFLAISLLAAPAVLAQDKPDEVLEAGEHRSVATLLAGRLVRMAGEVPDFLGAGQTVTISGEVLDNALAMGQDVELDGGSVAGDLLAMGQTITIEGLVSGDLYAGCETLRIGEEGVVLGNLYLGAAKLIIDGRVEGTLQGGAERIVVTGTLGGGDVYLGETGSIELGPAARITGDLSYHAAEAVEVPAGAEILGLFEHVALDAKEAEDEGGFSLLYFLWCLVAAMIVGLVLLAVAGPWMRASAASIGEAAGRAFGWGALWLLGTPLAILLVMISIVGIPLGVLGAGLYAAALYLAALPMSLWLGDWLLRRMGRPAPGAFLSLSLGLLIYKLLAAIPWLGVLVVFATLPLGLGAMFLGCRQVQAKLKA